MTDQHTPTPEAPEIGRTIRVLRDPQPENLGTASFAGQSYEVKRNSCGEPVIYHERHVEREGSWPIKRTWPEDREKQLGWTLTWEYADQPVAEEPTDWRYRLVDDEVDLEFRDGSKLIIAFTDAPSETEFNDWCDSLPGGHSWRPLSELPEWARPEGRYVLVKETRGKLPGREPQADNDRMGAVEWVEWAACVLKQWAGMVEDATLEDVWEETYEDFEGLLRSLRAAGGARGLLTPQLVWKRLPYSYECWEGRAGELLFVVTHLEPEDEWVVRGQVFDTLDEAKARAQELLGTMLWPQGGEG